MSHRNDSVLHRFLSHAEQRPEATCVTCFSRRKTTVQRTFGEVAAAAGRAAAAYQRAGVGRGDIVVLVGTHQIDFYAAWLGACWLGAVPTVLAEPSVRMDRGLYWQRLKALLARVDGKVLALAPEIQLDTELLTNHRTYDQLAEDPGPPPPVFDHQASDLLLLQHSSGTTGMQKGVMLSDGAVLDHATALAQVLKYRDDDLIASWLPLYHDMGFIACFVNPLIAGLPVVWISPFEWVANPALWLEAIGEHRATLSWLPNFAFAFLAQRVRRPDGGFDLSSLRQLINCSEPVTNEAMAAFAERFADDGFDRQALGTCYAMAETVFAVTSSSPNEPPKQLRVDRAVWQRQHLAQPADQRSSALELTSSGVCLPTCELRIVDPSGAELPPFHAGRVLIRAPYLFAGYFRREDLNAELIDAQGFFDSGDLGFVDPQGHLWITGRHKDLVIVAGRNVYPQEVEDLVGAVDGIHPGRVVCFGVRPTGSATEALVVLAESQLPESAWPELLRSIRRTVPSELDLDLWDTRLQPRGKLRKSTSGKLARDGNRSWYLEGRFGPVAPSLQPHPTTEDQEP